MICSGISGQNLSFSKSFDTGNEKLVSMRQTILKPGEILFPNAFKWNGTGPTGGYWTENQTDDSVFRPFANEIINYKLKIYNRWGSLIYESSDVNKGWDGYSRDGSLAPQAVYVWIVTGKFVEGTHFNKTGDVTFLH